MYDVAIVGGGLAGLTLSALLGAQGHSVICLDQAPAQSPQAGDLRTTAISYGSHIILEHAGIWPYLQGLTSAIEHIDVLDGDSPVLLNFLSSEMGDKSFGWIVLNSDLRAAMLRRIKSLPKVQHKTSARVMDFEIKPDHVAVHAALGMDDKPQIFKAKLVVGADGRQSFVRDFMGIPTRRWTYRQRAVICTITHEHPHHQGAVEHFWPDGPFALLPMADDATGRHRSSVVFTEHGPLKKSLMRLSDAAFENVLATMVPGRYGTVTLIGPRAAYDLGLVHAARYIGPRMVLVADAAHGIHPVAGQGLNLGFRDIKALADILKNSADPGAPEGLEAYQRARRFDNMTMVAVTDGLVRLFSNKSLPIRLLRRTGLRAVGAIPAAKRFFMRQAMGDSG